MMIEAAIRPASQVEIRRAGLADLPGCAAIINDYVDETAWLPRIHSRGVMERFFTPELLDRRTIWIAVLDGAVAGYISLGGGIVHALYLAPSARGLGIGKALLDRAKKEHPAVLELTVFEPNTEALRFYDREGFREVEELREDETEEGVPTLFMRWQGVQ